MRTQEIKRVERADWVVRHIEGVEVDITDFSTQELDKKYKEAENQGIYLQMDDHYTRGGKLIAVYTLYEVVVQGMPVGEIARKKIH